MTPTKFSSEAPSAPGIKHKKTRRFKQLTFILFCLLPALSVAQTTGQATNKQIADHLKEYFADINQQYNYSKIEYDANLPDERLNLETCAGPLTIENRSPNRKFGRLTMKISCDEANKPWAVNIGVMLTAYDTVIVSSRAIPKGSKITADMVVKEERNVTRLHRGYFKSQKNVVGSIARFSLGGNRVLQPGNVLPPTLVSKGEKVVINAATQGLEIRASGIALSDGALGELVRVKNVQTKRIIEGRVSGAGRITVSL